MAFLRILVILIISLSMNVGTYAQSMEVDVSAVKQLVINWSEAHRLNRLDDLSLVYADTLDYYGSRIPRPECISKKRRMLERESDFQLVITRDLLLTAFSNGIIRCDIVAAVRRGNEKKDISSYLLVKLVDDRYRIVAERDLSTDQKAGHTYFGTRVTISDVPLMKRVEARRRRSILVDLFFLLASVTLGVLGLLYALRKGKLTRPAKKSRPMARPRSERFTHTTGEVTFSWDRDSNSSAGEDPGAKGYAFEKYVVKLFDRKYFTLLDWRSDKFHDGIYAKSTRDPDLVYEFAMSGVVKKFSVECKYRSKPSNDWVKLMDEEKYNVYEAYHRNTAPVYIALGLGGSPANPLKLYLIPFEKVRLEMSVLQLAPHRKNRREFYYDLELDRLR